MHDHPDDEYDDTDYDDDIEPPYAWAPGEREANEIVMAERDRLLENERVAAIMARPTTAPAAEQDKHPQPVTRDLGGWRRR